MLSSCVFFLVVTYTYTIRLGAAALVILTHNFYCYFVCPGSPAEKTPGSATKISKKPPPLAIPTLASSFPFSIMHLLSAVRAALILNYVDGSSDYHDLLERVDSSRERFDLELPYVLSEGTLINQSDHPAGVMGGERLDASNDESEQRPHIFHGVTFHELVRRVHLNPGDPRILDTLEPLQVC